MHLNRPYLLIYVGLPFLSGCIEPYSPDLPADTKDIFVISGEVTNHEGYQNVEISRASSIGEPQEIPVTGSTVSIEDDKGNLFTMHEYEPGKYRAWIQAQYLQAGTPYRLHVITPTHEEIISDYDTMYSCPDLDSIYYQRVEMISPVTGENVKALQFYADFHGSESDSRLYRFSMVETWEHHSAWPIQYYYAGQVYEVKPWDYSLYTCWNTKLFPRIYTLSTKNLISNDYIMLPLSYADNTTTRLFFGYSLLIIQHALSEAAYNYWEQLRINNDNHGGLYEKQPLPVEGNLRNLTNPDKRVLGNFGASGTSEKRIFVNGVKDMGIYYDSICSPYKDPYYRYGPRPVYFVKYGRDLFIVDKSCIDCRLYGGVIEKPQFWPK